MIISVEMYTAQCDSCGYKCEFGGGDYSCYPDRSSVKEEATDSGWIFLDDDKCYCNECYEIDDNDNLIIKNN